MVACVFVWVGGCGCGYYCLCSFGYSVQSALGVEVCVSVSSVDAGEKEKGDPMLLTVQSQEVSGNKDMT